MTVPCSRLNDVPSLHPIYSHCAEAIVSFARGATLVGRLAATLLEFTARWVITRSDYDRLIAWTMDADWLEHNQLVLSTQNTGHVLYKKFDLGRPDGKIVKCHWGCPVTDLHSKANNHGVRITCDRCKSRCTVGLAKTDRQSILGSRAIIKLQYPPPLYLACWKSKEELDNAPPALTLRSSSLPTLAGHVPPQVGLGPRSHKRPSAQDLLEPMNRKKR